MRSRALGQRPTCGPEFVSLLMGLVSEFCIPGDAASGSHSPVHKILFHTLVSLAPWVWVLSSPGLLLCIDTSLAHLAGAPGGQFLELVRVDFECLLPALKQLC